MSQYNDDKYWIGVKTKEIVKKLIDEPGVWSFRALEDLGFTENEKRYYRIATQRLIDAAEIKLDKNLKLVYKSKKKEKVEDIIVDMNFGKALDAIKMGKQVYRLGWNGKGMFLFLIGSDTVQSRWTYTDGKQDNYECLPFIGMKTVDNKVVPWLASQTDILAEDWRIK